jgi:hypothetical protein
LHLSVDDQGLKTRAVLDIENNVEAKALRSSIMRGDISGMSYIFSVRNDEWQDVNTDHPKRLITDIAKIWETGAVSFPANPGTDISARSNDALESAQKVLESARARAKELDSSAEVEILKLKNEILSK